MRRVALAPHVTQADLGGRRDDEIQHDGRDCGVAEADHVQPTQGSDVFRSYRGSLDTDLPDRPRGPSVSSPGCGVHACGAAQLNFRRSRRHEPPLPATDGPQAASSNIPPNITSESGSTGSVVTGQVI